MLLAAFYAIMTVWDAQSASKEAAAWDAFALATDTSDPEMKGLQRVAGDEQYAGTKMQEWAYVGWADQQVVRAMSSYFVDREVTKDRLTNVVGIYEELASGAADPQVLNRARFGLARVYELQNKLDEAKQQYLTVRGDLQRQASERAEQLDSEKVREACAWLATAELPKRDLTGGQGASGERPEFDAALPTGDSITEKSLEELLGELNSDSGEENRYGEDEDSAEETDDSNDGSATDSDAETDGSGDDAASE